MRIGFSLALATMAGVILQPRPAISQDSLRLAVSLPDNETWMLISEQVAGDAYSKEWILEGQDYETTEWLIAQQKIPVDSDTSASDFLEQIYEMTEGACTKASHEGPDRIRVAGQRGAVGRTICSQRIGEEFGAFSDRLVLVENNFAYIITSELRTPPMIVEGVLSFTRSKLQTNAEEFQLRDVRSHQLVREGVTAD